MAKQPQLFQSEKMAIGEQFLQMRGKHIPVQECIQKLGYSERSLRRYAQLYQDNQTPVSDAPIVAQAVTQQPPHDDIGVRYHAVATGDIIHLMCIPSTGEIKTKTISKSVSPDQYATVLEAIQANNLDTNKDVHGLFVETTIIRLHRVTKNRVEFVQTESGSRVLVRGQPIGGSIPSVVFQLWNDGRVGDAETLMNFLDKLVLNPTESVFDRLFDFIQHNDIQILPNGNLVAFKRIRENYTDIHSGKFDNSVGTVVAENRALVDDDPNETCSTGLHACAKHYLANFHSNSPNTDRVISVEINPRDVVSIPTDYDGAKLRCCEYYVIADVTEEAKQKGWI